MLSFFNQMSVFSFEIFVEPKKSFETNIYLILKSRQNGNSQQYFKFLHWNNMNMIWDALFQRNIFQIKNCCQKLD